MARDGPKWGREVLFPANKNLADILGRTDFDFEIFYFLLFLDSKFPDFQVSRFPDFRKIGPYSLGDHFSESCLPRKMVQNGIGEIFWGQTFKNTPYFNLRVPDFWKPWTCGYVAAGAFFFRKMAPIGLEALNLWVRCRRRFFFSEKWLLDFCHVFRLKSSRFISVSG